MLAQFGWGRWLTALCLLVLAVNFASAADLSLLNRRFEQLLANWRRWTISYYGSALPFRLTASPVIESLTPASGPAGTVVTIHGRSFLPHGNIVYTGYGQLILPSADGATLQFTIQPNFNLPANFASLKKPNFTHLPLWFYVRNQNGLSQSPAIFALTF